MKKSYKESFLKTNFVKPLYGVNIDKTPILLSDIGKTVLVGDAFSLTHNVSNITVKETQKYRILPGSCEDYKQYDLKQYELSYKEIMEEQDTKEALSDESKPVSNSKSESRNKPKHISFSDSLDNGVTGHQETWLRVYPAPILPDETFGSIVLRFAACQLGITVFIIIWTSIWVTVIHSFEGPNENLVNEQFVRQQNQLVIDLATELRLITPISPKWQKVILARVDEARQQTMLAAGRGAKLEPGRYWNVAGTFLFTVYVMTALGFGAPVPQTVGGRCFALLYAVFAIPFHIYLNDKMNIKVKAYRRRNRLSRFVEIVTVGHCVPIACLLYYVIGVLVFGLGRYQETDTVNVFMFPLQYTTNGGLASVETHFRAMYGLYVEGAMALLTCSLAAMRRYSGGSVSDMKEKYRLFTKG